ncbi:hypothetical protein AUP68_02511 [Ilyonectria robusta]
MESGNRTEQQPDRPPNVRNPGIGPINSNIEQIQAQASPPDGGGIRYDLYVAQGIIGKARQVFAESQAALGDTQLEYHRLFREHQRIKEECESKHGSAIEAWFENDKTSKSLEEQTLKLKQVEHELELAVSHRELLEIQQSEFERNLAQDQHVIKDLAEEQVRYVAMVANLQAQAEKDHTTIVELQKRLEGYGFNPGPEIPSGSNGPLKYQIESENSGVAEEEANESSPTIKRRKRKARQ